MIQPPAPPKSKRGRTWLVAVVILVLVAAFVVAMVMAPAPDSSSNSKRTTPINVATLATSSPANTFSSSKALFSLKGTGSTTTPKFQVTSAWDLDWSYDCSSFTEGNFTLYVYSAANLAFESGSVSEFGVKRSDVLHYTKGGNYYLQVISSCSWSLAVKKA